MSLCSGAPIIRQLSWWSLEGSLVGGRARVVQLSVGMGWFLADDLSGRLRQGCADFDVLKKINPESAKEKSTVRCFVG